MSFYGKKWVWCLRKCYQQFQRLFSLNYWMLTQKVSHWICYIDDKQFRYPWCQKEGGGGGRWKQPPFHFLKEKLSGNKVCVKAALYSNKTSHKTYLREGRSTFAVSTVVNQLRKRYMVAHPCIGPSHSSVTSARLWSQLSIVSSKVCSAISTYLRSNSLASGLIIAQLKFSPSYLCSGKTFLTGLWSFDKVWHNSFRSKMLKEKESRQAAGLVWKLLFQQVHQSSSIWPIFQYCFY